MRSGGGNGWDNDDEPRSYGGRDQRTANNGWNNRGEEQRSYGGGYRGGAGGASYGGDRGPMKCYNCNEIGHSSRDCPDRAGGGGQNRSYGNSGQV